MDITFTLTTPATDSTIFTIVGNPGGYTHNLITKAMLLSGYTINFVDSVTGGTITATNEICVGTEKIWRVDETLYSVLVYGANTTANSCNRTGGEELLVYTYNSSIHTLINGENYYDASGNNFSGVYSYYSENRTCRVGYFSNGVFITNSSCAGCTPIEIPD